MCCNKSMKVCSSCFIMQSFQNIFEHQSRELILKLVSYKTIARNSRIPMKKIHMLTMIVSFSMEENLGTTINSNTQIDIELNSLSDIFLPLTLDNHLRKMKTPLTELMNKL